MQSRFLCLVNKDRAKYHFAFQLYLTIMASGLGVPVKLLHESLGHIITVELKTGQLYRGTLAEGNLFANSTFQTD
jgi:hypothetical protein